MSLSSAPTTSAHAPDVLLAESDDGQFEIRCRCGEQVLAPCPQTVFEGWVQHLKDFVREQVGVYQVLPFPCGHDVVVEGPTSMQVAVTYGSGARCDVCQKALCLHPILDPYGTPAWEISGCEVTV